MRLRVDIAFPRRRLAVLVDGCFWHACPVHYATPRTHATYWTAKIARNCARDAANDAALAALGWRSIRIWEHMAPDDAASLVLAELSAESRQPSCPHDG